MSADAVTAVETVYRSDWGRIVATLIRLLGDFDLAEEYAQEAFAAALDQWPASGVPEFPHAWIVQTARHQAIDRFRRQTLFTEKIQSQFAHDLTEPIPAQEYETSEISDERLRLIFTCCHPTLALEAQVALTLRTLCGLETDECQRLRWHSGWCEPSARSETLECLTLFPRQTRFPRGSIPCRP